MRVIKNSEPASVSDAVDKSSSSGPAAVLDGLIDGLDGAEKVAGQAAEQAAEKGAQQVVQSLEKQVLNLLNLIAVPGEKLAWFLDSNQFEQLWGLEMRKKMAEPLAEIALEQGWDVGGVAKAYGPYLALAMAVGPSAWVTAKVYGQAKEYRRQQAAGAVQGAAAGGGDGDQKA